MHLILVQLVSRNVALPLSSVRRVVLRPNLENLPEQPNWLVGWLRLGPSLLPTIDLSALLQEPKQELGLYNQLIVIATDRGLIGILVDKVLEVCVADPSQLKPLDSSDTFLGVASAHWVRGDQSFTVLAPSRIFSQEEKQRLLVWQQISQSRVARLP